jgi:hypothetical protein
MVFAPTFRGMRASLVRKAVAAADRGARRAATRVGVVGSVKRLWRRRLSGRGAR